MNRDDVFIKKQPQVDMQNNTLLSLIFIHDIIKLQLIGKEAQYLWDEKDFYE